MRPSRSFTEGPEHCLEDTPEGHLSCLWLLPQLPLTCTDPVGNPFQAFAEGLKDPPACPRVNSSSFFSPFAPLQETAITQLYSFY